MASNITTVNVSQPQIPIFKGDSYEFWSIKMKTLFKSQDLWDFVESGFPEEESSDNARQKENLKKDAKALFFIQQAVDESIYSRIAAATSSKHVWETLKTEYQGSAKVISVKPQSLSRNFKIAIAKILRNLPPKFDHVVAAIEESKDMTTLAFDEFIGSLQAHEVRINRNVAREDEQVFQVRGVKKDPPKIKEEAEEVFEDKDEAIWFNARARHYFKALDETRKSQVRLGNDNLVQIEGKGTVSNYVGDKEKLIKNINYAPGLAHNLISVEKQAMMSSKVEDSSIWHERYGHLYVKGLQLLANKQMVNDLPSSIQELEHVCEGCALGKQTRKSFPKNQAESALKKLELIHVDICGPMRTESLARRIRRQLTAPYTPEQNGVVERKNRTVVEMARSMMKTKDLSDEFWAEAVATAVYILNISPTKAVWNMTPYEAYRDVKFDEQKRWTCEANGSGAVLDNINNGGNIEETENDLPASPQTPRTPSSPSSPQTQSQVTKFHSDGSIQEHKARLVAHGFVQEQGIDFDECFSPMERLETVIMILALAAQHQWTIYQFDVKQAPRAWYSKIDRFFLKHKFERSPNEPTLYYKGQGKNNMMVVSLYVDEVIYTCSSAELMSEFKASMMSMFEMADMGQLHYFLGLEIKQTNRGIFVSQQKYATELLKQFNMVNCKTKATPMNTNEKLMAVDGTDMADARKYRGPISWLSKKKATVSLSSAEAEYVAVSIAATQAVWLQRMLCDLKQEQQGATLIYCDSSSAIAMTRNPIMHGRTKHIEIKYHYIRELVARGKITLELCRSMDQLADLFTKALPKTRFEELRAHLQICNFESRVCVEFFQLPVVLAGIAGSTRYAFTSLIILSANRVEGSFKVSSMMASIDEDVEKSSLTDQDDVGSSVSSSGQN
ncbi:retrovirus-related pol polyprotein from transposon TNT 1-94 [Tanacetum coccineum]